VKKIAKPLQQSQDRNVFSCWSVFPAGHSPVIDEGKQMKGIMIAVCAVLLGTLTYITIGIALASVS
jgi:hypothetical protein